MELAIILAGCGFIFSLVALGLSLWNTIHIQAQKQSTHTVIPIAPNDTTMEKLEKHINDIAGNAGADQSHLNKNLFDVGMDPEDLV